MNQRPPWNPQQGQQPQPGQQQFRQPQQGQQRQPPAQGQQQFRQPQQGQQQFRQPQQGQQQRQPQQQFQGRPPQQQFRPQPQQGQQQWNGNRGQPQQFHNPFTGISQAGPSFGGAYISTGRHRLQLIEAKIINSTTRGGAPMFIAEFVVLESSNLAEMPKQSRRSWCVNFQHPSALSNVKHFVAEGYQIPFETVDEDISWSIVTPEQPLRGFVFDCDANNVTTRRGNPFTKCLWTFVSDGSDFGAPPQPQMQTDQGGDQQQWDQGQDPQPLDDADIPF